MEEVKIDTAIGFDPWFLVPPPEAHELVLDAWRNDPLQHQLDEGAQQLLQRGVIYLLGRDKQFKPVIWLDATQLNFKKQGESVIKAICVFLDMIRNYMFIDGVIENWFMIIETGELGIMDFPFQSLGQVIGEMQYNYCARLDKMFLLNPSFGLSTSWSVITKFIDDQTKQKIQFLQQKQFPKLYEYIDKKYLQEKYGGTHPNLDQFWPPKNIYATQPVKIEIEKEIFITPIVDEKQLSEDQTQLNTKENNQKEEEKKDHTPVICQNEEEVNLRKIESQEGDAEQVETPVQLEQQASAPQVIEEQQDGGMNVENDHTKHVVHNKVEENDDQKLLPDSEEIKNRLIDKTKLEGPDENDPRTHGDCCTSQACLIF